MGSDLNGGGGGGGLTAAEVMERMRADEAHAARLAAVAGDRVKRCTYADGYMEQPVYACLTCTPEGRPPAGVCLGCSMECHVQHEVIELWSKRHFRCDCGNDRFPSGAPCELHRDGKDLRNDENVYGHNFRGRYCHCDTPWDGECTMMQCVGCQDWFHAACLSGEVPDEDGGTLCRVCVDSPRFAPLLGYAVSLAAPAAPAPAPAAAAPAGESRPAEAAPPAEPASKRQRGNDGARAGCTRPKDGAGAQPGRDASLPVSWRDAVCRCDACAAEFQSAGCADVLAEPSESADVLVAGQDDDADGGDEGGASGGAGDGGAGDSVPAADRPAPPPGGGSEAEALGALSRLPRPQVMHALPRILAFNAAIKKGLAEWQASNPGQEVTQEVARDVAAEAKRLVSRMQL